MEPAVEPPWRPAPPPPSGPSWWAEIDWERWFGVRAAAVLGGIALALAGLLFFKYSIEHGLIPPWMRVILGTILGVGAIAGSEWRLRRDYPGTANALAGGGVVVLYAAFWAAGVRYDLVPVPLSFVAMGSVTAVCTVLAWRHVSLEIALLGLAGGFATPFLLSTGADRPVGLFGYLLLLDLGLLTLARARRWPRLAVASLGGTLFYQALWIGARMGPDRLFLGLAILAVFAVVFLVAGRRAGGEAEREWLVTQAASVLVPFAFALYLAGNTRFGSHLYPIAMLLVLLGAAAGWLGRVQRTYWLGLGAATGSVVVTAVFLQSRWAALAPSAWIDGALAWEVVAVAVTLALVFHVFVELEPARPGDGPAPAAIAASGGFFALLILAEAAATRTPLWPWLAGWAALATLLYRHARFPERARLQLCAALALGIGLAFAHAMHDGEVAFPGLAAYLAIAIATAIALQVVALARGAPPVRRAAEEAAALLPLVIVLGLVPPSLATATPAAPFLLGTTTLGFLAALAATRLGAAPWLLVAIGVTALAHTVWAHAGFTRGETMAGLGLQSGAVVLFTAWPFLAAAQFRAAPLAWYGAALVAPAWFLGLKRLFELHFGDAYIGLVPMLLACVSLAALARVREVAAPAVRTGAVAWFAAAAMGFVTVAIPLQLEKEWITIGWALEGLAVTILWTRLDYAGLKWFGLALLAGATARLVANPAVLGYYPRSGWRIVNWLLYTYLVPAGALAAASSLLRRHELGRARPWERARIYVRGQALGADGTGLAALVVVFVWINLAIADWFARGRTITVSLARLPARDLATSIAWGAYALVLLALGVRRRSIGLRWVSLGLMMLTIAKVFLHDLGELRDLYRVASLLGLAVSLLVVSVAYQRFVFRPVGTEGSA